MNFFRCLFYFFIIIFLLSCNRKKLINLPSSHSQSIIQFNDANEVLNDWSGNNTIVCHVMADPDNLHPTNGNSSPRSEILYYTQRTLIYIDFANQTLTPGLVKSMPEISTDGLKYTYNLRDSIFWDNGNRLTTEDIVFTAKAFKCPFVNDASVRLYWENLANVIYDKSDSLKFTFVMTRKHLQNISFLTGFPVLQRSFHDPKNILSAYSISQFADSSFKATPHADLQEWANEFNDDKYGRDPVQLNGLGMYKVSQWSAGQYITLERKKNHWSQSSADYHEVSFPEKIIFKINKDETAQILEFRSQEMDVSTNLATGAFLRLNEDESFRKNYNAALLPTYNYSYIAFNEKPDGQKNKKLFSDVNVRHALSMLTPVDEITKFIYHQYANQCKRMVSNVSPLKKEFNKKLKAVTYDFNNARELLTQAGWTDSDGDGILDKIVDGEKISMNADLNYLSSSPEWKNMAMIITEVMAKAGIRINPLPMDLKLFIEKAKSHQFDLMLGSWGGTGLPEDYSQLWSTSAWTNHGSNYSGFGNSDTDALIDSINSELNDSTRHILSYRLQEKIYDDQPYIFLFSNLRRNVIHKRFANQMLFPERPGVLLNMLRLLSINKGITIKDQDTP